EPEPLTLANLTTKSLTDSIGAWAGVMGIPPARADAHAPTLLPTLFPRRRESRGFPDGRSTRHGADWIPAFAGMTTPGRPRLRLLRRSCRLPRPPVAAP